MTINERLFESGNDYVRKRDNALYRIKINHAIERLEEMIQENRELIESLSVILDSSTNKEVEYYD